MRSVRSNEILSKVLETHRNCELRLDDRDFGEVLRHELNNPLAGILGNAELLLLEVRRGKLDLPPQTLQRIEIITELAVRMRETVQRLSDPFRRRGKRKRSAGLAGP